MRPVRAREAGRFGQLFERPSIVKRPAIDGLSKSPAPYVYWKPPVTPKSAATITLITWKPW